MSTASDLAPRDASKRISHSEDPFASPVPSIYTPSAPASYVQPAYEPRPPPVAAVNGRAQYRHDSYASYPANTDFKSGSVSSTGASSIMTPISSIDLEKASIAQKPAPKRRSRDSKRSGGSRDPEKAEQYNSRHASQHSNREIDHTITYEDEDDEDQSESGRQTQSQKAVQILLYLSGPCVVVSAMNTVWAIIAIVITALSQPIRICARRPSFGEQLAGLLGPTLNLQLRCIYTPLPPHANEDRSYHNGMLFLIHLLSPFLSFAVMFAAWTLAVYWLASGMVGDPAGQDKRDDGKETVLALRKWWERWLLRGVREG